MEMKSNRIESITGAIELIDSIGFTAVKKLLTVSTDRIDRVCTKAEMPALRAESEH